MPDTILKPGSDEAAEAGCKCPRIDNGYGNGYCLDDDGKPLFVIHEDCPLHGATGLGEDDG